MPKWHPVPTEGGAGYATGAFSHICETRSMFRRCASSRSWRAAGRRCVIVALTSLPSCLLLGRNQRLFMVVPTQYRRAVLIAYSLLGMERLLDYWMQREIEPVAPSSIKSLKSADLIKIGIFISLLRVVTSKLNKVKWSRGNFQATSSVSFPKMDFKCESLLTWCGIRVW